METFNQVTTLYAVVNSGSVYPEEGLIRQC